MNRNFRTEPATVSYSQVSESPYALHRLLTEASDLGLPPGVWPRQVFTRDIGNYQPFMLVEVKEGEAIYKQWMGCTTLVIVND